MKQSCSKGNRPCEATELGKRRRKITQLTRPCGSLNCSISLSSTIIVNLNVLQMFSVDVQSLRGIKRSFLISGYTLHQTTSLPFPYINSVSWWVISVCVLDI